MSWRPIVIAAQAAAVAVSVVVVYTTLLRPDSNVPLHGIEAPSRSANQPHEGGGHGQPPGRERKRTRGHGRVPASGGGTGGPPTAIAVVATATPERDQYSDSVSALLSNVGGPAGAPKTGSPGG